MNLKFDFPFQIKIELNSEFTIYFQKILNFLINLNSFINLFLEIFSLKIDELDFNIFFDLYYFYLLLIEKNSHLIKNNLNFPKKIFSSKFNSKNQNQLLYLKYYKIKNYFKFNDIFNLLNENISKIEIFTEIIFILYYFPFEYNIFIDKKIIRLISTSFLFFQQIHLQNIPSLTLFESNIPLNIIENSRAIQFLFLKKLFLDKEIFDIYLKDKYFIMCFLTLILETEIRPIILNILKGKIFENFLSIEIISLCDQLTNESNKSQIYLFFKDILKAITEELNQDNYLNLFPILQKVLNSFEIQENSNLFLLEVIHFFTRIKTDSNYILLLEKPLKLIGQDINFFKALISLLFGFTFYPDSFSYPVQNPHVLNLLFSIYGSNLTFNLPDIVTQICSTSIENIELLNKSEFDIQLVTFIYNNRDNNDISEILIIKILKVISLISYYYTSPQFIQIFLSCLLPIDLRTIPKFYSLILKSITKIFKYSHNSPPLFFSLTQLININIINSNEFDFSNGLHFSSWILLPNSPSTLFRISKGNDLVLKSSISNEMIKINNTQIPFVFQRNKWYFLSFSIYFNGLIKLFINGNLIEKEMEKIDLIEFKYLFVIGGNSFSNGKIGNFLLSPLKKIDEIIKIYKLGPRFCFKNEYYYDKRTSEKNGFIDIFYDIYGIEILLPLFAHLNLINFNNIKIINDVISLFNYSFICKQFFQKRFYESQGFQILSYLLRSLKSEVLK